MNNNHIPTKEIEQDIEDTKREILQYTAELTILNNNPVENKLQIYLKESNILQREDFIKKLQLILKERL